MHPRDAEGFEWDEGNRRELAAHGIKEWEAEQVFLNDPEWPKNKRRGSGDRFMVGYTNGGRALTLVVTLRKETRELRVITGWDCTAGECTRYLRKWPS
jgi:uncharacterized DUF497 family protein